MNKLHLLRLIDSVIAQGEAIRRASPDGELPGSAGNSWYPRIMSILHVLGDRADPWKTAAANCPTAGANGSFEKLLGVLGAIREAVDHGLLNEIEESTRRETLNDLIDQALAHIEAGRPVVAGVLGSAVLLEHLDRWCMKVNCRSAGDFTICELSKRLYLRGHLAKSEVNRLDTLAVIGQRCEQNHQPPVGPQDVQRMVEGVRRFVLDHPLPS